MNFFTATKRVFLRELRRIAGHHIYVVLMVILPVVSLLFFAVFFKNGVPTDIPIAVVDNDHTTLSRKLTSMIDATPAANVDFELQSIMEAEELIKQGEIQAVVMIPENFEKDIYGLTQTSVEAYVNGLNISANGMLSKDIQTAVLTFSSGIQIQMLTKKGLSEKQAYAAAMPISFDKHVLFNPYVNYGYYLLPSFMPMMLMIFSLMLSVYSIGSELKGSTSAEWFNAAGGRTTAALIGKLLPYTLAMFLVSLFMNAIMYEWCEVPLNGSKAMLIMAALLFVLAYQAIGVVMITLMSNMRLSLSIGGGYSVLAFTFSGLTFPLMAMEWYVRMVSYAFPFTFYTEVFIDQALRGAPVEYSFINLGYMSLFILLPILLLSRIKKIATNKEYWGRL